MVRVEVNGAQELIHEAKEFQDLKSFEAIESPWRLFEFEMSHRYLAVKKLAVHLETEETVYMYEEVSLEDALDRAKTTELNAFFQYNATHPNTKITYINFPKYFIFEKGKWKIRKQGTETIGRIFTIHPSAGELFYLRMLL